MLVKEVVVRVVRRIVSNFGEHWRSPELGYWQSPLRGSFACFEFVLMKGV